MSMISVETACLMCYCDFLCGLYVFYMTGVKIFVSLLLSSWVSLLLSLLLSSVTVIFIVIFIVVIVIDVPSTIVIIVLNRKNWVHRKGSRRNTGNQAV